MNTFDHIDYNAPLKFDWEGLEKRLASKRFQKRLEKVIKEGDELLRAPKVDASKMSERFGS